MKKTLLVSLLAFICTSIIHAQAVYVDSNIGDDKNSGTKEAPFFSINKAAEIIESRANNIDVIKINPGIYVLDKHVSVATEKSLINKRIVIEATILPDDTAWTPDKMPIIITRSQKGEIMEKNLWIKDNWITSFYINESHVTIRGLKFQGYNYPVHKYYPISRFNKEKRDLLVEQCIFIADRQSTLIQVGVIAHGDEIKVNRCIFYNTNNAVIYWEDSGNGIKTGNSMTNCIVYGATGCAIWTSLPDKDFIFKNNIVTNCNFFWIKEDTDTTTYTIDSCVIVNNQHYKGDGNLKPSNFALNESNVIKEGEISLRMINNIWEPWPNDHLHVIPNTLGYNIRAGLFNKKGNNKMMQ
ncbi:MAG: hypothetical protein JXB49_21940 [Bacteroidales bacterium]|nr:hypothetical protein [Bacteroidales bacterium]